MSRSMVALLRLGPYGFAAQRDLVSLQHLAGMHQLHRPSLFVDDDAIGLRRSAELSGDSEYE